MLDDGIARLGVVPQLQQRAIETEIERGRETNALSRLQRLGPVLGEGPERQVDLAEMLQRLDRFDEARRLLSDASARLQSLRSTPARRALAARISDLQARGAHISDSAAPR